MGGKAMNGKRLDYQKADALATKLEGIVMPHVYIMERSGSLRRKKESVGDIDFVCIPKESFFDVMDTLEFDIHDKKTIGLFDGVQVEFNITTRKYYGAALLYASGCMKFNIYQRWLAKRMGLLLNQTGLYTRDKRKWLAGKTERSIFKALGMKFVKPELRVGWMGGS